MWPTRFIRRIYFSWDRLLPCFLELLTVDTTQNEQFCMFFYVNKSFKNPNLPKILILQNSPFSKKSQLVGWFCATVTVKKNFILCNWKWEMKEASELYFPADETMINETWHFWQPTLIYDEKGFYSKRGQASAWELSERPKRAGKSSSSVIWISYFFVLIVVAFLPAQKLRAI